jgi:hypothetical protein
VERRRPPRPRSAHIAADRRSPHPAELGQSAVVSAASDRYEVIHVVRVRDGGIEVNGADEFLFLAFGLPMHTPADVEASYVIVADLNTGDSHWFGCPPSEAAEEDLLQRLHTALAELSEEKFVEQWDVDTLVAEALERESQLRRELYPTGRAREWRCPGGLVVLIGAVVGVVLTIVAILAAL